MSKAPAPTTEKPGGRVVVLLLLGLLVLFGGLYATAYVLAGDNVPRGTTVSGVRIGGEPHAEAAQRLEVGLAERLTREVTFTVDGEDASASADELGFSVDYDASVAEAGGRRSWHPVRLWEYFTGGEELEAVVVVDEEAFGEFLEATNAEHGRPAKDGTVTFEAGEVRTTSALVGKGVDPAQARARLIEAFLAPEPRSAELVTDTVDPEVSDADVQSFRESFADQAVSGPVIVGFGEATVTLEPGDFAPALAAEVKDGALAPVLDADTLHEVVADKASVDGKPVDATVAIIDGKPQVVPGKPGVTYDHAALEKQFLDVVTAQGDGRTVSLPSQVAQPGFTTEDAEALGITEKVSRFTTYFPYAEYRNVNIGRAAELVNGTVLKPGETFSLNGTVGERTRENGFTEGFMIADGVFKSDLGGGVSQMATTLFNAAFFAGLKDVEHKPHSFYIDRYPVGREATVAWGSVDLRFKNDTEHGVLIEAHVAPGTTSSQGVVTVTMWSTKVWDITSKTGERHNFTSPATRTLTGPECVENSGYGGFDIDVKRIFRKHGSSDVVRTEVFHTTYTPRDTVICK